MSLYDPLARFIEENIIELSRRSAERAVAADIPVYKNNGATVDYIAPRIVPTLEVLVRYTLDGNPDEYRKHIVELTNNRLASGYDAEDIILVGNFMFGAIKDGLTAKLTGPEREHELLRYKRRLDSLHTLGAATVIATRTRSNKV